jgi:DNA-binding transcriptional LysR family regulator
VAQEAIQMQTIVNLVWGGLGLAWVPESVTQFRRAGVVYRAAAEFAPAARRRPPVLPACETSLVWPASGANPALGRFVQFIDAQLRHDRAAQ